MDQLWTDVNGFQEGRKDRDNKSEQRGMEHTGDTGLLDEQRYLRIADRKKEIFKLSAGKYIALLAIENILKESPFIGQVTVIGENQKFAVALISTDISPWF